MLKVFFFFGFPGLRCDRIRGKAVWISLKLAAKRLLEILGWGASSVGDCTLKVLESYWSRWWWWRPLAGVSVVAAHLLAKAAARWRPRRVTSRSCVVSS